MREDAGHLRVGITDYAQDALGDVVYVQLPAVGLSVGKGDQLGEIESTKSVSAVYAPVSGVVIEINADLGDAPEQVNSDPYEAGWLCVLDPRDTAELTGLLDSTAYLELTKG